MGTVAASCVALATFGGTAAMASEPASADPRLVRVSAPDTPIGAAQTATPGVVTVIEDGGPRLLPTAWPAAPGWAPSATGGGAGQRWLVVIIQATLAERGCSRLAVNGEWDEHTQQAAASVIGSMNNGASTAAATSTASMTHPNDELLRALRSAKVSKCGLEGGELQTASRTDAPVGGRAKPVGKGAKSAARLDAAAAGRGAAAARNAGIAKAAASAAKASRKAAVASAPRQTREAVASVSRTRSASRSASGPVAFMRPVGIGSF